MPRRYGKVLASIWDDDDFLALSSEAQRLYMFTLSQAKLSLVGMLEYKPKRWADKSATLTVEAVQAAAHELHDARFIVLDERTDELIVRTIMRHDIGSGALNSNLVKGIWSAWASVESRQISAMILANIPDHIWTFETVSPPAEAMENRWSEPSVETHGSNPGFSAANVQVGPVETLGSNPGLEPLGALSFELGTVNEENTTPSLELVPTTNVIDMTPSPKGDIERVFDAWLIASERTTQTKLDPKRRRLITKALKDYPVEDVIDAVRGWRWSPHHAGQNARQTVYNGLHVVLRDSEQIEKFRDLERGQAARPVQVNQNMALLAKLAASDSPHATPWNSGQVEF